MVRVVVARCAAELGCQRAAVEHGELLLEAVGKHLDLLAEARGRGRLAVRLGQHGNVFPLLRVSVELRDEFLNLRHVDLGEGVFEHEGERRVVDVLGREAEMDKFLETFQAADSVELFFNEILDGFHIVVRHAFDVLDAGGIFLRKLLVDAAQAGKQIVGKSLKLRQRQFAKRDKILDFHADAIFHQSIFRKIISQGFGFAAVASVDRRHGGQDVQFHGKNEIIEKKKSATNAH